MSLFNKVAGLQPATFLKRDSTQAFSYEVCEIFKNTYFEEHLRLTAVEQLPLNSYTITNFNFTLFILFIIGKLVNTFSPGTMPEQASENDVENCRLAMDVAKQRFDIDKIISPDEMANPNIPELAIMAYTVQFTKVKKKPLSRCVLRKSYSENSKKYLQQSILFVNLQLKASRCTIFALCGG